MLNVEPAVQSTTAHSMSAYGPCMCGQIRKKLVLDCLELPILWHFTSGLACSACDRPLGALTSSYRPHSLHISVPMLLSINYELQVGFTADFELC
ncbi:hypothetical protein GOP47_0016315 [Adiantum capillus-veneris]|uniref:Uncharacterized protein n=1 Tax=Adiantum capillus-veneris TaxID=13818 RepID=A0A9D4UHG3_ADICA|nr:hypothetical protein GOP47_0016315 [Adiantum capillus-veneris]